jgi:hypothetical protein
MLEGYRRLAYPRRAMEYALAVAVLVAVVALFVAAPLREGAAEELAEDARRAELEAAKEAKYREIRDAQLDLGMGKLSEADHRAVDRELRAQAIAILEELDSLSPEEDPPATEAASRDRAVPPAEPHQHAR